MADQKCKNLFFDKNFFSSVFDVFNYKFAIQILNSKWQNQMAKWQNQSDKKSLL